MDNHKIKNQKIWGAIVFVAAAAGGLLLFGTAIAQTTTTTPQALVAPTCVVSASPSSISRGEGSTLSWSSNYANSLVLDQGIGTLSSVSLGSLSVAPVSTQTYTATFAGPYGTTTCMTTVTVTSNSFPALISTTTPYSSGTSSATPISYPLPGSTPAPMIVQAGGSGNILIRGTVKSVGSNMVSISSWGGTWSIRTNSESVVLAGASAGGDVSSINLGDFVGASGTVASDQSYTIDASLLRDWTTNPSVGVSTGTGGIGTSSPNQLPGASLTPTTSVRALYIGTVSNIETDSFTLTDNSGNSYTVNTDAGTTLWDMNGNTISFSDISSGDRIRLNGTLQGKVIFATVVRDTSI